MAQTTKLNWGDKIKQRKFLEDVAKKLNIKEQREWGGITRKQILQLGGGSLLVRYNNSLIKTLSNVFSDVSWNREWFSNSHNFVHGYWKKVENQRTFLRNLALKLNIKNPQEWGQISRKIVIENGGGPLLRYHNNSIFKALIHCFPDISWKQDWFSNLPTVSYRFWTKKENQRKYMDEIANRLKIKKPSDWGSVTLQQVIENGGRSILKHYGDSLFRTLTFIYSDTIWKREWFTKIPKYSPKYWISEENQKKFLDNIAIEYKVIEPSDWRRITLSLIRIKGGQGLLRRHNNSIFSALTSLYPEMKWERVQFNFPKYPPNYWESKENQRRFMDEILMDYNLSEPNNWKRVSISLIRNRGGQALLSKYDNSLLKLLESIYPNENWAERTLHYQRDEVMSEPQLSFLKKTQLLFPF